MPPPEPLTDLDLELRTRSAPEVTDRGGPRELAGRHRPRHRGPGDRHLLRDPRPRASRRAPPWSSRPPPSSSATRRRPTTGGPAASPSPPSRTTSPSRACAPSRCGAPTAPTRESPSPRCCRCPRPTPPPRCSPRRSTRPPPSRGGSPLCGPRRPRGRRLVAGSRLLMDPPTLPETAGGREAEGSSAAPSLRPDPASTAIADGLDAAVGERAVLAAPYRGRRSGEPAGVRGAAARGRRPGRGRQGVGGPRHLPAPRSSASPAQRRMPRPSRT